MRTAVRVEKKARKSPTKITIAFEDGVKITYTAPHSACNEALLVMLTQVRNCIAASVGEEFAQQVFAGLHQFLAKEGAAK